jgi:hypothetical protein
MVAAVAGSQMSSVAADNELAVEAIADAKGNLRAPDAYRTISIFRNMGRSPRSRPGFGRALISRSHQRPDLRSSMRPCSMCLSER